MHGEAHPVVMSQCIERCYHCFYARFCDLTLLQMIDQVSDG